MPFDTSTRLYSLLAEMINVPICNEKRPNTICIKPMLFLWSEWRDLLAARLAFGNARGEIAIASSSIASASVSVEPLRKHKDTDILVRVFRLVGVARLELAALRSRTVRATKLRYTPFIVVYDCF